MVELKESLGKKINLYEAIMEPEPMSIPIEPAEINAFRSLSKNEKSRTSQEFYSQDFVKEYFEKKWKAELHNRDCFLWLWEGYKNITDKIKHNAISGKMTKFKIAIFSNKNPYKALALDFSSLRFLKSEIPKEVIDFVDMFSGKVVGNEQT